MQLTKPKVNKMWYLISNRSGDILICLLYKPTQNGINIFILENICKHFSSSAKGRSIGNQHFSASSWNKYEILMLTFLILKQGSAKQLNVIFCHRCDLNKSLFYKNVKQGLYLLKSLIHRSLIIIIIFTFRPWAERICTSHWSVPVMTNRWLRQHLARLSITILHKTCKNKEYTHLKK